MRDRVTGDPRGFAFVVFRDGATVDLVMAEAKHEINHKIVDVKRAQARGVAPPSIHEKRDGQGDQADRSNNMHSRDGGNKPTPEQLHNKVFVGGKFKNISILFDVTVSPCYYIALIFPVRHSPKY